MTRFHRTAALAAALTCVATGVALMVTASPAEPPPPRDEQWKKVEEAVNKGLPKTAIEELEPIIAAAIKDKAYPEAIRAVGKKIVLEANIQGNKPEEKIVRMKAALATAPPEMHPVLHAVLAHWYWHYFQQNRWRIVQRSAAGEASGDDVTTWDLPRIFTEIDRQFDKALSFEKELKATKLGAYDALLDEGTVPADYRPTLYDFLAFEAVSFYTTGEQAGAKAQDAFTFGAATPAFAPVADFLKWRPETTDDDSRTLKAVRLYQNLLAFHQDDKNPDARLDTDLHRLRFAYNTAVGPGKDDTYIAALKRYVDDNADHPLGAMARYQWAGVLQGNRELVKARDIALAGVNTFPDSDGGKLCFNLVRQIEAKSSRVTTERVWADPMPEVDVRYKNVTKVHFRVVKADFVDQLKRHRWRPEHLDQNEQQALLREKPALEFSRDLPPTPDYQERTETFPAPKGLAPGFYYLIASHDPGFGENDNVVTYTDVWVSDLAIVTRADYGDVKLDGFVLKGESGLPVEGAQVQAWFRDNNGGWAPGERAKTDANGMYTVPGQVQHAHLVIATHDGDQLASAHDTYLYRNNNTPRPHDQTVFFTDRSLYRPGQTIQFKGICIHVDQDKDNYATIAGRDVAVTLNDPNGKLVETLNLRTNDYGSFAGSFTAPRDRLTGQMSIRVTNGPNGATQVSVEEYKRPKFIVEMEAPRDPAKLNAEVKVPGKATAYTGVPIGGAKLVYRVVREVQYPPWFYQYCWWRPVPQHPAQEIAHGELTTEGDGTFTVPFVAQADPTVPAEDEPSFKFTVNVDVTDTTGETRSDSRVVEVGYVATRATVSVPEWNTAGTPTKLTVATKSLDGQPQEAKGTLRVYKLKQPERVARPDLGGVYRPVPVPLAKGVEPKPDPAKPVSWELGDVVLTADFATKGNGTAEVLVKLDAGLYRAVVETHDPFGKPVKGKTQVQVIDPKADRLAIKVPDIVEAPKWSVEPGSDFTLFWGTGYDTGRAFLEVEHRGEVKQAFWTAGDKTQAVLTVPVTEAMRGGFTVRVTYVRENRAYLTSRHVDVPWSNKQLTVKWETFRSKLKPGEKETFTAVVTGPDAKKAVAEMVAAVYDQSLDAYRPHAWMGGFGVFRRDHSRLNSQFENTARYFQHLHGQWPTDHKSVDIRYPGFPNELTQNYARYDYFGKGGGTGGFGNAMYARGRRMEMLSKSAGVPEPTDAAPVPPGAEGLAGRVAADSVVMEGEGGGMADAKKDAGADKPNGPGGSPGPNLEDVTARKNLNETAFFYPHLVADGEGVVRMEFTMPEALTKWKFLGFAHDTRLRAGTLTDDIVTAKDLMAQPNAPRFLRVGDVIEFPVKVSNRSAGGQKGKVRLGFRDARTDQPYDDQLGLVNADQEFDLPAGESKTFAWRITVPEGTPPLIFKAVAASDRLSDGEEGVLPVLAKKVLVAESMTLPIRGVGTKQFDFVKLRQSAGSDTIRNQSYTVQMVSQPAWYAVLALPYLMEFPHECTEQSFNRLYANGLARHIAQSDPKIRKVFDRWKGTDALDSPLEKNQDLKDVMLEETPWLRDAVKEGQARRNVGVLFDDNRMSQEVARLTRKMAEAQKRRRDVAVVPGRAVERVHHPVHHDRVRAAPAPRGEGRDDPGVQRRPEPRRLGRPDVPRHPPARQPGRQPPVRDDRPVPVRPQLLPRRREGRRPAPGGGELLARAGEDVLAPTRHPAVAGAPRGRPQPVRRQGDGEGDRRVDQGAVGLDRGDGHVLARPGIPGVVVPRPGRDPGHDDRGVRRGGERPAGRRGLQGLAPETEADPELEDDEGHGRRRVRPAAPR